MLELKLNHVSKIGPLAMHLINKWRVEGYEGANRKALMDQHMKRVVTYKG